MEHDILETLIHRGVTISTMESCTGGLLASTITDVSGASGIFPGGFVTYSNAAKIRCGVPESVISTYGVYSAETASAMAQVCRAAYGCEIGIGITGSLGRVDPANADSVPGEVFYCIRNSKGNTAYHLFLPETLTTRREMKEYVVASVLDSLAGMYE